MSRSIKKGPFVDEKLFAKIEKLDQQGKKEPVKTWARACTIVPEFVGHTFLVHNGKAFLKVNGGASSAHAMNVVFADDVTGISEAKAGFAAKVGKFIEDGKLMILKKGKKFNANGQLVK